MIDLDQPVEVYAQLNEAIKYGPDPIGQDKFDHAKEYLKLLKLSAATPAVDPTRLLGWIQRGTVAIVSENGTYHSLQPLTVTRTGSYRIVVSATAIHLDCELAFDGLDDPAALVRCKLTSDQRDGTTDTAVVRPGRMPLACKDDNDYRVCTGHWTHTWSSGGTGGGDVKLRLKLAQ